MTLRFLPNEADATFNDQAEPDSVDFEILLLGHANTGVVAGCGVTGTGSMSVDVAIGQARLRGSTLQVAAQAGKTIATADGSNPRVDLVTINSVGTAIVTSGTAAANPVAPSIPANSVPLAFVYVPTSDTTITDNQINDKRVVLGASPSTNRVFDLLNSTKDTIDTLDDEFESTTLDAKWTVLQGDIGTVDPLSRTNQEIYDLTTRPGWLLMQVGNDGSQKVSMWQDLILADGESVILAVSPSWLAGPNNTVDANSHQILLTLNTSTTDETPATNAATIYAGEADVNRMDIQGATLNSGGSAVADASHKLETHKGTFFIRIFRDGTDYHSFYSVDGTTWQSLMGTGTGAVGTELTKIWIAVRNTSSTTMEPVPITAIKWIRQGGSDVDPWDPHVSLGGSADIAILGETTYSIDTPPLIDDAAAGNDEFDDGLLSSSWTWENQGSATEDESADGRYLLITAPDASSYNIRLLHREAPSTPYTYTVKAQLGGELGQYSSLHIGFRDSVSDEMVSVGIQNLNNDRGLVIHKSNSASSFGSAPVSITGRWLGMQYWQIEDDGTDIYFRVSMDGVVWVHLFNEARTTFLDNPPDQVFIGVNQEVTYNDLNASSAFHWSRFDWTAEDSLKIPLGLSIDAEVITSQVWADYETEVAADTPLGWLKLNEASGSTAVDSGSAGQDGTYISMPAGGFRQPAPFEVGGYSVQFDGIADYVDWDALDLGGVNDWTTELWALGDIASDGGFRSAFGWTSSTGGVRRSQIGMHSTEAGHLTIVVGGHNQTHDVSPWNPGQWNHIVVTRTGSTTSDSVMNVWINGTQEYGDEILASVPNGVSSDLIRIGLGMTSGPTNSYFWEGRVAQPAIYDKALSPARILSHFNAGIFGPKKSAQVVSDSRYRDTRIDALYYRPSSEAVHADDQEFNGALDGTEVHVTGTRTWKQDLGALAVRFDNVAAQDVVARVWALTPSSPPVTIDTVLNTTLRDENFHQAGILFSNGTASSSNLVLAGIHENAAVIINRGTFTTIENTELASAGMPLWSPTPIYFRLVWTAANTWQMLVSPDGLLFTDFATGDQSFTMSPTHIGVYATNWNASGTPAVASWEYLRVTEADLSL